MRIFAPSPLRETLIFTAGIMVAAGMGFGIALRSAPPQISLDPETSLESQDGGGLFHSEQSFPPKPGWNLDSEREAGESGDGTL